MVTPKFDVSGEKTLPMTVANTGFMVDRLGQDCSPLQFLRELTQNSIEAILDTPEKAGQIVWDVDWDQYALTDVYKLAVTDTGVGMSGPQMVTFINQLSSSVHEQSHVGNFGVGAKIAAATRNHEGLIYLSWQNSIGSMIHLWRDPVAGEYGLRQLDIPGYGHWAVVDDLIKPEMILEHGTKVVLLGNSPDQNTMAPPEAVRSPSRWISRYLNARYFRFPEGIVVKAREGWEHPRTDTDRNVLRTVMGQEKYLAQHSESSGVVPLKDATARWWILKEEPALSQNTGFVASNGHVAALYKDELYEMAESRSAVARLQQFGVVFGYTRVVIYVEPSGADGVAVTSNTARTALLMNQEPLPWSDWASEFREKLPDEVRALMDEVTSGSTQADHRQSIRERLRQIRELFRLSRYRITPKGELLVDDSLRSGGSPGSDSREGAGTGHRPAGPGGRAGNIYAMFLALPPEGVAGEPVSSDPEPDVRWVTVGDGTRPTGFLEDRAASYLAESNLLQINGDFRVFTDMVDRWVARFGESQATREVVQDVTREWFEQALVETVLGVQSVRDSRQWTIDDVGKALSEEALTAAVMPRYHIDVAIKRALGSKLGSLRDKAS